MIRRTGRRHAAEQRLHLQGVGPTRICGPARLAHSTNESPRHGAQYEPATDDPARGAVWTSHSRGRARRWRRSAASPPSSFARASSGSSSSRRTPSGLVNDRNFNELGNERDPIIGAHDGTLEFKIPKRPIRKKIVGPACLHHAERRRVLLSPGHQGAELSCLTERTKRSLSSQRQKRKILCQRRASWVQAWLKIGLGQRLRAGCAKRQGLLPRMLSASPNRANR